MSYYTISVIARDEAMLRRVEACAATEQIEGPENWAVRHMLAIAAQPGWASAWESALAADPDAQPGRRDDVITDGMILAAVQAMQPFAVIAPPLSEEPGPA